MAKTWQISGSTALENRPQVIKINAVEQPKAAKLRVAAYTRVSSDSADQLNSFAAQNRYYNELISGKPEWILVDLYADEGFTGTSAEKREDFQRMMADCRRGLVDQILVKSISRFARNTKDCLQSVRELKELGVNVRFERESIDTANVSSELITAIYAAFAQKESESISGNMRWSYQRRMESGTFLPSAMAYGYKIVDKKIEIDPDAALVVCRIFQWYLDGISKDLIAKRLNEEGIPTTQNKNWHHSSVHYILTNEKYIGDSLWQKSYTTDTLPVTRYKNKGERQKYYAEGTHPPIIAKETFAQAQKLMQFRKGTFGKKLREHPYPLSKKVICGNCGTAFRRNLQREHAHWCCMKHDKSPNDCAMLPIAEERIYNAFCRLYYKLKHHPEILEEILSGLQTIRNRRMLWSPDIVSLNKKISELSSQNQTLAFLKQQGLVDPDIFISQSNELTKQLRQAKLEKEQLLDAESDMTAQRTQEIMDLLEAGPDFLDTFDAELFGELVEKVIIVESNDFLRFRLKNGLELREAIERTVR